MSNAAKSSRALRVSFSIEELDAIVGGVSLQAPPGGSVRESTSNYSWWGMNYQQTTREALDANGNVVGTEVYRPGSIYSDRTTTNAEGSSTEYSTGGHVGDDQAGAGFNASFTTHHDADGNFTGANAHADAEAHANGTPIGDLSANGSADGGLTLGPNGSVDVDGHAQGQANIVDPESGYGLSLRGEANGTGHLGDDGANWSADAKASGFVTHDGEDVAGLTLGEVGTTGRVGFDENGDLHGQADFRTGVLGGRVTGSAEGTYHSDGTIEGSLDGNLHAGTEKGQYSASFDANAGIHGQYNPDGSIDAGVHGGVNGEASAGDWSVNGGVSGRTDSHFDSDYNYTGTDVHGEGQAELSGPNLSASVNGSGDAHFDQDGNLTGANGEVGANANVLGQEFNYSNSGTYEPSQSGQEDGTGYQGSFNEQGTHDYSSNEYASNDYSANDASSNEYASTDYSSNDYSSNGYSSNDYGSTDYASNDTSSYDSGSYDTSSYDTSSYDSSEATA